MRPLRILAILLLSVAATRAGEPAFAASPPAGVWVGELAHAGETSPIVVELEAAPEGGLTGKVSVPAIHAWDIAFGKAKVEGNEISLGPMRLTHDPAAATLTGVAPAELVPVHSLTFVLRRGAKPAPPARPEPGAPQAQPVWTFDAGSPIWADLAAGGGAVYAGADDGRLHALRAADGKPLWSFQTGGAIRARPTLAGGDLYVASDDGFLYLLRASDGKERRRMRIAGGPTARSPLLEDSRFLRFASAAAVADGRAYVGSSDGRLLAFDAATGSPSWEFKTGDSVVAAPLVQGERLVFGSFDGHVYALAAETGKLLWKRDTRRPVVSTPAEHGGLVIIGSRSYDLMGLDAATGSPAWNRYIWFSWIESSATVRDGIAYVGSSDAAKLFAIDAATGRSLWELDVLGWAWGQPAVTDDRVYIGTVGTGGYVAPHRGGVLAVDRRTGRVAWWHRSLPPSGKGQVGFAGSPAIGDGLVFVGGLDGRVAAFRR